MSLVFLASISFSPAFADPHTIDTADNDLATPGCLETVVGCYTPNTLTIDVGHTITMTNTEVSGVHTFTSGTVDGFAPNPDGTFDSGILISGDSFTYNANTVGEYPYYCALHVWMQGMLIVQEAEAEEEVDQSMTELIPKWIKNNAGWWADGLIEDDEFLSGIQFLIDEEIIIVSTNIIPNDFPSSLKEDAKSWSDNEITDTQFLEILENWIENKDIMEESSSISVWSDKSSYVQGDTINILGQVTNPKSNIAVSLIIIAPNGNIVSINQVAPASDGSFTVSIQPNSLWKDSGEYDFDVEYGDADVWDAGYFSYSTESTEPELTGLQPEKSELTGLQPEKSELTGLQPEKSELTEPELKCGPATELVNGVCQVIETDEPEPELVPPTIHFMLSPAIIHTGKSITFDASDSYDPDGTIKKYEWWFGDGSSQTGKTVSHTFSTSGVMTANLKITDNDYITSEEYFSIAVSSPPITGDGQTTTDPTLYIIAGVGVAAAIGGGIAISKRKKPSIPQFESSTQEPSISEKQSSRTCNVCGTIIPKGQNVCPNCGDIYSI